MRFELGKYTDVTKLANSLYSHKEYAKVFICPDIENIWLVRVLVGYNEEYEKVDGAILFERDNPDYEFGIIPKGMYKRVPKLFARTVLEQDQFENWDMVSFETMEELLEVLDGGFGIIKEEE